MSRRVGTAVSRYPPSLIGPHPAIATATVSSCLNGFSHLPKGIPAAQGWGQG